MWRRRSAAPVRGILSCVRIPTGWRTRCGLWWPANVAGPEEVLPDVPGVELRQVRRRMVVLADGRGCRAGHRIRAVAAQAAPQHDAVHQPRVAGEGRAETGAQVPARADRAAAGRVDLV